MGQAPLRYPPAYGGHVERSIYEPPAPLDWVDRHPHLATLAIWSGGVAVLMIVYAVFS
jgi:hypothetical protein